MKNLNSSYQNSTVAANWKKYDTKYRGGYTLCIAWYMMAMFRTWKRMIKQPLVPIL
jgi:hypothetical protein